MKNDKIRSIIAIILFAALIMVPLCKTDVLGGKISETENRRLAEFPISRSDEGEFSVSRSAVEHWIEDNIGFRSCFVNIYSTIKSRVFKSPTTSTVLKGKDGWYFYTNDYNIEIATGEYPLSQKDLELIAEYQQQISDYYHSIGKEYILMLTPSKVSVYPEYLPMADETVKQTPVDVVTNYLQANTDVIVYNSKTDLLAAKGEGQLFHKTDTHWNDRGSYVVYKGLFSLMKEKGIAVGNPIDVTFVDGEHKGEFSYMMGNARLLSAETAPFAEWRHKFEITESGETFEAGTQLQNLYNPSFQFSLLENKTADNQKTLQIYGDSQLEMYRKIPMYMAENFSTVLNYAIRNVNVEVDSVGNPDVVVFSCSERYIADLLTVPGNVPAKSINVDLGYSKLHAIQQQGYQGMNVDSYNGKLASEQGTIDLREFDKADFVQIEGWAADFETNRPLSALYLKVGDSIYQCAYGKKRTSVSEYFGIDTLCYTGFSILIPMENLLSVEKVEFIQIGTDGSYRYPDVQYNIYR